MPGTLITQRSKVQILPPQPIRNKPLHNRLVNLTRWALLLACACCIPSLLAQSKRPEDLAVGKILVTPHEAPDPLFAESVIVLVQYSDTGALGLMINNAQRCPFRVRSREWQVHRSIPTSCL